METFEELLDKKFGKKAPLRGKTIPGVVTSIEDGMATVDVGLKSEGKIPVEEFERRDADGNRRQPPEVGDSVRVFVVSLENADGGVSLSRDRTIQEEVWEKVKESYARGSNVEGTIQDKVRGGYLVNVGGAMAFLPNTQVDVRPVRNASHLLGQRETFQILKVDDQHNNIVVSRRAYILENMRRTWADRVSKLEVGAILPGVVKNTTEYGAFVDIGGVDGLLHVTDMSWGHVNSPQDVVKVGERLDVKVLSVDEATHRLSLGLKQLTEDPWEKVDEIYHKGMELEGKVTNVVDYGVFVDLGDAVEGLVHVSEMNWVRRNVHPSEMVKVGDVVKVQVLDVDKKRHRIALGMKQLTPNPWEHFATAYPEGAKVESTIVRIGDRGISVSLEGDIEGLIVPSDLDWLKDGREALQNYGVGDTVEAKVLSIEPERGQVFLGVKQLTSNPLEEELRHYKVGDVATGVIEEVDNRGLRLRIGEVLQGIVRRSDWARDRYDQRPERFAEGERVDGVVTSIGKEGRLVLSIKRYEERMAQEAVEKYGSSDAGASLGDILGVAIEKSGRKFNKED